MRLIVIFSLLLWMASSQAQDRVIEVLERKDWCLSSCNLAGDEKANTAMVYRNLDNYALGRGSKPNELRFPIRVGIVQADATDFEGKKTKIARAIDHLNRAFASVGIIFYEDKTEHIVSNLTIETLSEEYYEPYNLFSKEHDMDSVISLFVFDHADDFCQTTETSISCGRKGGFSYILSELTNNVALSTFDLDDQKIVAHEFGHFFGLYHTFEETQYGKDHPGRPACDELGDRICDTPPDPGAVYEVYVNYSNCEMLGFEGLDAIEYKPLVENYMSYYKPCYLREYSFTLGQVEVLRTAAYSDIRSKFSR